MRRRSRKRAGTLVEAMVAAVMTGLALVGIVSVYGFSVMLVTRQKRTSVAYHIARKANEQLRAGSYALSPDRESVSYFDGAGTETNANDPTSVFEVVSRLTTTGAVYRRNTATGSQTLIGGLRTSTVTVRFLDLTGEPDLRFQGVLPEVR